MMAQTSSRNWTVLLLGGHSGTGKTTVSRILAQRFGTALSEVDDFRLVLEGLISPEQQPALFGVPTWEQVASLTSEQIRERLIQVGRFMSQTLEIVVANHVATNAPLILEGDGLVPSLAVQSRYANRDVLVGEVCAVFIVEPDEDRLLASMRERERGGFRSLPLAEQQRRVHVSWLYGQWLQQEAENYHVPVVCPQPWQTLADRIVTALGYAQK